MFKRTNLKRGGGAGDGKASKYHTKKDGTKAKKGLYFYMNRAKKKVLANLVKVL